MEMKKLSLLLCSLALTTQALCGPIESPSCPYKNKQLLVGQEVPYFTAKTVIDGQVVDFSLQDLRGKYVVVLFYPLDFTFVCPTELHAFQEKAEEFALRNAQVVACSVDSVYSHLAWLNTPREIGGIEGIEYPLISDLDKSISRQFHVLNEQDGVAYRGLFLIDREGVIRHQVVNDLPLGRNVDEALRMLDALITYENYGEVCPANWQPGQKTLKPTAEGLIEYFSGSP
jgi:peroxiredoxin (alkyl hydroperoxide reductase subunit C)